MGKNGMRDKLRDLARLSDSVVPIIFSLKKVKKSGKIQEWSINFRLNELLARETRATVLKREKFTP